MPWTRSKLLSRLRERGLAPKKALGQNFLLDPNFLDALVAATGVTRKSGVVEIGAGVGNLTERLAAKAGHVWAFEIDPDLFGLCVEELAALKNVTLLNRDGADFARHVDPGPYAALTIVSNLPYFDYQRILLSLVSSPLEIDGWFLMLQKDVVDRLLAGPGDARYGPLSALIGGLFDMKVLRKAGPGLFYPAPRVESAVFRLRRNDVPCPAGEIPQLERGLRGLFAGRRKKLATVLRARDIVLPRPFEALADRRVESIEPSALLNLARALGDRICGVD